VTIRNVRNDNLDRFRASLEAIRDVFDVAPGPRCHGCGDVSATLYCASCAPSARCPHDRPIGTCDACDLAADVAFDVAREGRR